MNNQFTETDEERKSREGMVEFYRSCEFVRADGTKVEPYLAPDPTYDPDTDEDIVLPELAPPTCYLRHCKHYIGVEQPDGTELSELNVCEAFPLGIPQQIAYGKSKHLRVRKGQVGSIVFEPEEHQ
jgi:hypothetical protein